MSARTANGFAAALLGAASLLAACGGGSAPERATEDAPDTTTAAAAPVAARTVAPSAPQGAVADCSTQSWADFTGAFFDPANLVVGPLVLVGGATPTPASVVEAVGGNKFPLLVRDGHTAALQVPLEARAHASLGYGPLPQGEVLVRDGHDTVTFVACDDSDPSRSTADVPVTFWSGFLLADEPLCLPLDVWTDGANEPRRIEIELGAGC
jgi:hypothetical protein